MRLQLSPEDQKFREEMREFFTTQVPERIRNKVLARQELSKEEFVESQQILNAAGLAVPGWPVEWGGQDWSQLQRHIWHEEMQLAGVPQPLPFNAGMVGPVIAAFGSQELKERFLAKTANIDIWWSQGFSEPDAGSDLAGLRTTAIREGDEYIVNGQKTWTTLGQYGDWIFMLVRTDPKAAKKQEGISFLLIDMTTPGVTVRPIELIDGGFEVNEVFFENVRVPAENLVGEENKGWTYAKFLLGNERVGIAQVGASQRHLATAKSIAKERGVLDRYAARIVTLENELLALETTALRVAAHSDGGRPHPASSVLKIKGSQLTQAVSELLMDLEGPTALTSHDSRVFLNNRKVSIYGGSNEVQRTIIAGTILGL
ncbi:acyl-CoA dehydrogenase [Salinibacterium sp. dk2585]|uniref:acyl-CoA dehydrogenase family protein n=1 Tax=unclassified Salinibacterium TaxID=2632331 RepID=UPI0011C24BF4|nr:MULTISPECIES: acyl-CoA dehydrogenase family protein [unclassified Salinibacterium]QEE62081.1 acyl-CoA dehydrogenase [Salinibacterium sp. dk2585]TXK53433.1 acyl-CoA dehydrogenase [Salinibacterium sp. dk5596]